MSILTAQSVAVVYREGDDDSLEFATYYADAHGIDHAMLMPVPCSGDEILASYADFQSEVEQPLLSLLDDGYGLIANVIVVGYGVPGGFEHNGNVISTTSRLSRINHTFDPGMSNPLFARQRFRRYDESDAEVAIIVSRIDAPTLDEAKAIVNNMRLTARQGIVNGKFYFDPFAPLTDDAEEDYQSELLDFEDKVLPLLNLETFKTTYWDEYTDVVVPRVDDDSFMWAWKSDRAGFTFFGERKTARIFLYNGDTDGAASVRDSRDKRWPMLALKAGYAATAGATSDPLPEGLLRPKPFFDALFRGATVGEAFLFAVPNLDWTVTLFGDPLLQVKFPTPEVILDGFTSASGFNVMEKHLRSAIAHYLVRESQYVSLFTTIKETQDVSVVTELLPAFAALANYEISQTKPTFSRLVAEFARFPTSGTTLGQYLYGRGDRISRLLPVISVAAAVPSGQKFDVGYWEFEDEIRQPSSDFAKYTFELELSHTAAFADDDIFFTADSNESISGWYYEKESNQFVAIPTGGIMSSYAGRRIKYIPSPSNYFASRQVYYARIRQVNEFSEPTEYREFKQVVGT